MRNLGLKTIFSVLFAFCLQNAIAADFSSYMRVDNRWPYLVAKDGQLFYWNGSSVTRLWEDEGKVTYGPQRLPVYDWVQKAVTKYRASVAQMRDGLKRADETRWPNLYRNNGQLYYMDSSGVPIRLHMSDWGNITRGDNGAHDPEIQHTILEYYVALMNEDPVAWDQVRGKLGSKYGQPIYFQAMELDFDRKRDARIAAEKERQKLEREQANQTEPVSPPFIKSHGTSTEKSDQASQRPVSGKQNEAYSNLRDKFIAGHGDIERVKASFEGNENHLLYELKCFVDKSKIPSTWKQALEQADQGFSLPFGLVRGGTGPSGVAYENSSYRGAPLFNLKSVPTDLDNQMRNYIEGVGNFGSESWAKDFGTYNLSSDHQIQVCGDVPYPERIGAKEGTLEPKIPYCCSQVKKLTPRKETVSNEGEVTQEKWKNAAGPLPTEVTGGVFGLRCTTPSQPGRVLEKQAVISVADNKVKVGIRGASEKVDDSTNTVHDGKGGERKYLWEASQMKDAQGPGAYLSKEIQFKVGNFGEGTLFKWTPSEKLEWYCTSQSLTR